MPEPPIDPHADVTRRVAGRTLLAGIVITGLKFGVFALTDSVSVLSDAFESIANIIAAGFMLYALALSNRPADESHPYGHGKVLFLTVGLEGLFILVAGLIIGVTAVSRLISGVGPERLELGTWLLLGVTVLSALLAWYVWRAGRRYDNAALLADAQHLGADVFTSFGVFVGLLIVQATGITWIDPLIALLLAGWVIATGSRPLRHAIHGLMDRSDPADQQVIEGILDDEREHGRIVGYHKVRHRHTGPFHWVDLHLQMDGELTVRDAHDVASDIEKRIEDALGDANATAHVEPESHVLPEHHADPTDPPATPPK